MNFGLVLVVIPIPVGSLRIGRRGAGPSACRRFRAWVLLAGFCSLIENNTNIFSELFSKEEQ